MARLWAGDPVDEYVRRRRSVLTAAAAPLVLDAQPASPDPTAGPAVLAAAVALSAGFGGADPAGVPAALIGGLLLASTPGTADLHGAAADAGAGAALAAAVDGPSPGGSPAALAGAGYADATPASADPDGPPADLTIAPLAGPIRLLRDDFNDGILSAGRWPASYGGVTETGGRARIDCDSAQWSGLRSAASYTLADSQVTVQAWPPDPNTATSAYLLVLVTTPVAGTAAGFNIDTGSGGVAYLSWAGFSDPDVVFTGYDPTSMAWLRLSESSGTLSWETSPDGETWTVRRTAASPSWVGNSDLALLVESHRDAGTDNHAEVDNVNLAPLTLTGSAGPADPGGVVAALSADQGFAAAPAGAEPHGLPAVLSRAGVLASPPADLDPAGTPASLAADAVLAAAPGPADPAGGVAALGAGRIDPSAPAGVDPAGAPAVLDLAAPPVTDLDLDAAPAGVNPYGLAAALTLDHTAAAQPAGVIPGGAPADLTATTVLACTPAAPLPVGTTAVFALARTLNTFAGVADPAGLGATLAVDLALAALPALVLPSGGVAHTQSGAVLVAVAAAVDPDGGNAALNGAGIRRYQPGVHAAGTARPTLTAATTRARLSAGSSRG